ncbi:MAG: ATP-binding cassette domain-containing protein [Geminicoccaceae bacterium]
MIQVQSLCLSFGERRILDGISFTVARGETLAIIGGSGVGKTSLARLLMGLLPSGPATKARSGFRWSGKVLVDELDVLRAKQRELRRFRGRQAGMITQALADALNPHLTVRQHLREVMYLHRLPGTVEEVCAACNIPVRLCNRYPAGLSGGEIQRVLTALAMLPRPPVLILDEPTASLDGANRARAVEAFRRDQQSRCQLLITHDHDLARELADRVAVLKAGRIVEVGRARDILRPPAPSRPMVPPSPVEPRLQTTTASSPGLYVHGLCHAHSGIPVLRDLSFHVPQGGCLAILGESGAGKSTLARILAGLEPLQAGQMSWVSSKGARPVELSSRRSAMVSQHPHRAMARHFTVEQVLSEALALAGPCPERKGRVLQGRDLLETVGLPASPSFLAQRSATLSGGEAQRLVIARALATEPDVLIADEPTAALDMVARERVLNLIARLKEERNLAIILVTHDADVATCIADHFLELPGIEAYHSG